MARNQKLSYKMNMFHFLTEQNYSKFSQISMSMSFSSLFEGGRLFEGGVYFKIRDFRGRSFEGEFIRGRAFIRGNTVWNI